MGILDREIRHTQQLFDAVKDAYSNGLKCQLLLEKGTRYGTTPGGVRAAVDGDSWMVTELSGDVASGFQFFLERVEKRSYWKTNGYKFKK